MIDWQRVDDLRDEIGRDSFGDVAALFLEEAEDVINHLSRLEIGPEVERNLHCLKGSALNLGFKTLAQICQQGERRAAEGASDLALDLVAKIYHQSRGDFLRGMVA